MKLIFVIFLAVISWSTAAQACRTGGLPSGVDRIVQPGKISIARVDATVRYYINKQRCAHGLAPLRKEPRLIKVATVHANWMAKRQKLQHVSTVRGQSKMSARLKSTRLPYRTGAENLVLTHQFQIEDGGRFQIDDAKRCLFSRNGKRLAPHTYRSLAHRSVKLWMQSKLHRKNILHPNFRALGTSIGFDPKAAYCGSFYLSQNFIG